MSRLNYSDILIGIKNILLEDADLQAHDSHGVRVYINDKLGSGIAEQAPCVLVELVVRSAPLERQRISAGRVTIFDVQISCVCVEYDLTSVESAMRKLDDLISLVEIALMKDRSLKGSVEGCTINGGKFDSLTENNHFIVGAEVNVFAQARTSY